MVRTQGFTAGRGDRSGVPNVMVLLTDGNSNNPEATYTATIRAKADGIHVITVGRFPLNHASTVSILQCRLGGLVSIFTHITLKVASIWIALFVTISRVTRNRQLDQRNGADATG